MKAESPARPAMAAMFRLQFEPAQDSWVLLYPEGMVRLNTPAAEILRRCDGHRSVDEIVAELEAAFSRGDLHGDVLAFLAQARERGWVQ
jgi:pyrroloquinoline quinone biosynthesis protein D